ncbi:winged helix-turn-helix transcriptional regulator [Mycolicibacterium sp. 018/SC-01/001]|uniref:MarR family winged helix-turn-helix transcriptional regulator n=1 Tax=Mycolicibacterium sp. 018/SC-01/001 TaxID=2592069 RepID=UPI00117DC4EC|nr:MarR family winged helix-turn-helix transcriptional regulator [Mycolicibacterium sp. 018/SC-01/001]TRW86133.1 winged helix-turn-helix transcriptional regulator [Mycolicibacterium sp. 018/SC-01/001]
MQARRSRAEQLADLADVVMAVARAVRTQASADPDIVELSATEVTVLRYIDHHPDVSAGTVAAGTGLQRSNLSRALRDLEAKGLVRRSADPTDSRQVVLRSTRRAAENLTRLRGIWATLLGGALEASGEQHDIASALELLHAIERNL